MKTYSSKINAIKKRVASLRNEIFKAATNGTHHKVFVSNKFAIRFRQENPRLLQREANFLKQLNHPLVPKILHELKIDDSLAIIENRLPGQTIDTLWKNLTPANQTNIIKQQLEFLNFLRNQKKNQVYSVNSGKQYSDFFVCLNDELDQKTINIKKFKPANELLNKLLRVINETSIKKLFRSKKFTLVHGDLIVHNLLTDGKNLTGVLDWELAFFGDPDYDLFRLFYYQECAKAYKEQGTDETFESDYMNKLIAAIRKSDLIKNINAFQRKFRFVRAIFYINALDWAVKSNNPKSNVKELIELWDKKRVKHSNA